MRHSILRRKNLIPRIAAVPIMISVVITVTGCTRVEVTDRPISFETTTAIEFFNAGFSYIQNNYINETDLGKLVPIGLNGLRQIEPALAVVRSETGDRISLLIDGRVVYEMKIAIQPKEWATAIVGLIDRGRAISNALNNASSERIYAVIFETLAHQLDAFSRYSTAKAAREERAKRDGFGGIGANVEAHFDGALIGRLKSGQPADLAGLRSGDRIVAINDLIVTGLPLRQIIELLRGPIRTKVQLTIQREPQGKMLRFTATRAPILEQTVFLVPHQNFAHIRLTNFNQDTLREMRHAIEQAQRELGSSIRGLIIDLRGNPGGLLDQAVKVTDLFLETGAILRTRGRHPLSHQYFDADSKVIASKLPMAVLVDGASASAAEIIASALQDHSRAIVVGASSFGKGTVQKILRLPNDGELVLTWAKMHAPSGYALNRYGVLPTICTSRIQDTTAAIAKLEAGTGRSIRQNFITRRQSQTNNFKRLQELCPWRPHEGKDVDLEVATGVLKKPELYDRVLTFAEPSTGS